MRVRQLGFSLQHRELLTHTWLHPDITGLQITCHARELYSPGFVQSGAGLLSLAVFLLLPSHPNSPRRCSSCWPSLRLSRHSDLQLPLHTDPSRCPLPNKYPVIHHTHIMPPQVCVVLTLSSHGAAEVQISPYHLCPWEGKGPTPDE
jgi:hypothetical protein